MSKSLCPNFMWGGSDESGTGRGNTVQGMVRKKKAVAGRRGLKEEDRAQGEKQGGEGSEGDQAPAQRGHVRHGTETEKKERRPRDLKMHQCGKK